MDNLVILTFAEAKQRQTAQLTARREEAVRRSEDRERELKATLENRLEVPKYYILL